MAAYGNFGLAQGGPGLRIVEQPQARGFRFRYQCEGGSHGGLQGENSSRSNKTYPTVQIKNYKGPARIVVSLVTDDEDGPQIHAHELVGRNCKNGVCITEVGETETMQVTFPSLGIQHVTKKKVSDILQQRLQQAKLLHLKVQDKDMTECDPTVLTSEDRSEINDAKERAKNMTLNVVRLCFRAYLQDPRSGDFTHVLPPAITHCIYDSKSPGAAALKICRMDRSQGCCSGGDEVFLLCDKVQKEDISVRFFEMEENRVRWEAFGVFSPTDVHRQYAIVFRTPPYHELNIQAPVKVHVQLKRVSDNVVSEPRDFLYNPRQTDKEAVIRKRRKIIFPPSPEENDMPEVDESKFLPNGMTQAAGSGVGDMQQTNLDQKHIQHQSSTSTAPGNMFGGFGGADMGPLPDITSSLTEIPDSAFTAALLEDSNKFAKLFAAASYLSQPILPSFSSDEEFDSDVDSPHSSRITKTTNSDIEDNQLHTPPLPNFSDDSSSVSYTEEDYIDYKPIKVQTTAQVVPNRSKVEGKTKRSTPHEQTAPATTNTAAMDREVEDITKNMNTLGHGHLGTRPHKASNRPWHGKKADQSRSKSVLTRERCMDALHTLARTGDLTALLALHSKLLLIPDIDGNSAVHQAIIHKHKHVVKNILLTYAKVFKPRRVTAVVNTVNGRRQTPTHLCVVSGNTDILHLLLQHNIDLSLVDDAGNTPLHAAVLNGDVSMLNALLQHIKNDKQKLQQVTNVLNFKGYSALHLSVLREQLACVQALVSHKVDTEVADNTSGYTALHHAIAINHVPIAGHLLLEGNVDVNATTFDGNTALHIASSNAQEGLAKLLVTFGADPTLRNDDYGVEVYNEDGEKLTVGHNPLDYAYDNGKMLSILHTRSSTTTVTRREDPVQEVPDSTSSTRCTPATSSANAATGVQRVQSTDVSSTTATLPPGHSATLQQPTSRRKILSGAVSSLRSDIRAELCATLDSEASVTWRDLAECLHLDTEVLKHTDRPTAHILQHCEDSNIMLDDLEAALVDIGHHKAIAVLQQAAVHSTTNTAADDAALCETDDVDLHPTSQILHGAKETRKPPPHKQPPSSSSPTPWITSTSAVTIV